MPTTGPISSPNPPEAPGGFGGLARDPKGEAYAELLLRLRGDIAEEMARQGLSRADMARRLGVHPSVVTRVMNPDADVLASTLFDLAWVLDREWGTRLVPRHDQQASIGNREPALTLRVAPDTVSGTMPGVRPATTNDLRTTTAFDTFEFAA